MSITNPVRKSLLNREITLGSWIQIGPYPALAEILGNVGYDWLGIDCKKHFDIDAEGFTLRLERIWRFFSRQLEPLWRQREKRWNLDEQN